MKNSEFGLQKKDLVYWILILVLVIITVLTIRLGDNSDVISYVGFGGTIASILLAIVALIYSFFQAATSINTTTVLQDSAKRIEDVTKKLDKVDDIKEITKQLESSLREMMEIKSNIIETSVSIEKGIHEVSQLGQALSQKIESKVIEVSNGDNSSDSITLEVSFTYLEFLLIYSLILASDNKREFNISKFSDFIYSKNGKSEEFRYFTKGEKADVKHRMLGFFDGVYFHYFYGGKLIFATGKYESMIVHSIDPRLEKKIIDEKEEALNETDLVLPVIDDISNIN
ncbi:hypothetical protein ABGV43_26345 [Paenibacillus amylolyticus]|uniref:hypothetical protein n=1 Tax=Paenibacillus amylolyticus TaxID=1451 RepID=UPI003241ECB0